MTLQVGAWLRLISREVGATQKVPGHLRSELEKATVTKEKRLRCNPCDISGNGLWTEACCVITPCASLRMGPGASVLIHGLRQRVRYLSPDGYDLKRSKQSLM